MIIKNFSKLRLTWWRSWLTMNATSKWFFTGFRSVDTCGANVSLKWTRIERNINKSSIELLGRFLTQLLTLQKSQLVCRRHCFPAIRDFKPPWGTICFTTWRHSKKLQLSTMSDHRRCSTPTSVMRQRSSFCQRQIPLGLKHQIVALPTHGSRMALTLPGNALIALLMLAISWSIAKNIFNTCLITCNQSTWSNAPSS